MKTDTNVFNSKLPDVGTTIFTVMSALSNEHGALNLSQGFPEFDCDPILQNLVAEHMSAGRNQYAPMQGLPVLRDALAAKRSGYASEPSPNHITITAGGTEAIYSAISGLIRPGDEVILFDPAYDCYDPSVRLNGGVPVHLELAYPDYRIPIDQLEAAINERTRLIIINNPHNPLGVTIPHEDMLEIQRLVLENDVLLLSDEVYEHIVFDDKKHTSVLDYPELYARSFVIFSFGKTFHNTGWKMGYCVAPDELTKEFQKVHQFVVFSCNTPVQFALADYLTQDKSYMELPSFFERKRNVFLESIQGSRFKPLKCEGTYFMLLDYSEISDMNDVEFAKKMTIENKIASIPLSVFYASKRDDKLLRFCFAKEESTLIKGGEILCQI